MAAVPRACRTARSSDGLAVACLLGLAFSWTACGSKGGSRVLETRAVVIGIDGADWKVIDALAATGAMPNLTRPEEPP